MSTISGTQRPEASTRKVLVVEDHDDGRELLADFLEHEGYQVYQARNGRAALELLVRMTLVPDVIVTDLRMPVMDGWSFCDELAHRKSLRMVPVIALTACPEDTPPDEVRVVAKPFQLHELARSVAAACDRSPTRGTP